MTDEDPRPLKSNAETPAELVRALRALGERERDAARLARVADQLAAKIASGATPSATGLRMLNGTKLGLAGLVVGLGVLGALGYSLTANRRAPAAAPAPVAEIPEAPVPVAVSPTQAPAVEPPSEPAKTLTPPAPVVRGERPRIERSTTRLRRDAPKAPAPAPTAANAASDTPAAAAAASDLEAQAEPVPAASAAPAPPPAQPRSQPTPAEVKPAAQSSELALLQRARKVASNEPAAALRLLREHSERYPSGTLTPEREMLTIEVLRRLGRNAEAAQRLQQFEVRYPHSIYLRRLQHGPAAADDF